VFGERLSFIRKGETVRNCFYFAALLGLMGCQPDRSAGLVPCGDAHTIIFDPVRKDSAHVVATMFNFEGGLRLEMDSIAVNVMDPVATHCGIKSWEEYAVHSQLGKEVDYLFFFKKTPYEEFVLNSFQGGPSKGVFVQVKHGTSELSCVDCLLRLPWRNK
jgi:hypothetical protein